MLFSRVLQLLSQQSRLLVICLKTGEKVKDNWPVPLRSDDGPVDDDHVGPELSVQSNTSEVDWLHPVHKPLSKLHETEANGLLNSVISYNFKYSNDKVLLPLSLIFPSHQKKSENFDIFYTTRQKVKSMPERMGNILQ